MAIISVVVPVFNTKKYLRRCVESILRQSFADFELILIDDGSTDGSAGICDGYAKKDGRVKVMRQPNAGPSAARNRAIEYALKESDSEWITCIDSDDYVGEKLFEYLLAAAKSADTEIAVTGFLRVDETEVVAEPAGNNGAGSQIMSPEEFYTSRRAEATGPCGKLYKKELFSGVRYPVGKLHEDEYVTYRLLFSCSRIAVLNDPLYYYVRNPDSIMLGAWTIRRTDHAAGLCDQLKFFKKNGFHKAEAAAATALFVGCAQDLRKLTEIHPEEKRMIRSFRRMIRKTKRRYALDKSLVGGDRSYLALAHPHIDDLRIKAKHALIGIKKVFHA